MSGDVGAEVAAVLDAIKAVREQAAEERVAMQERGEPLTDYSSGVLDGIDNAMLAAKKAAYRPEDRREATSPEEWWACEDAYQAGIDHALTVRVEAAKAEALREAADEVDRNTFVSTDRDVTRWLRDRAAALDPEVQP